MKHPCKVTGLRCAGPSRFTYTWADDIRRTNAVRRLIMQSIRIDDDELDRHLTLVLSNLKGTIGVHDGNAAVKIYTAASIN